MYFKMLLKRNYDQIIRMKKFIIIIIFTGIAYEETNEMHSM